MSDGPKWNEPGDGPEPPFDIDATPVNEPPAADATFTYGEAPPPEDTYDQDAHPIDDDGYANPDDEPGTVLVDRRGRPVTALSQRTTKRKHKKRGRRRAVVVLVVLALILVPFVGAATWFWFQVDPPGEPTTAVEFTVEPGWGVGTIADELSSAGIVGDARVFQLWARIKGAGSIQAGDYELQKNLGASAALTTLQAGPKALAQTQLALPPAMTIPDIAAAVGKLPGRSGEKFLELAQSNVVRSRYQPADITTLEGLTWPDTYFINEKEDELAILQRLVATFDSKMAELDIENRAAGVGYTAYQAVVAASLIQTEAKLEEEYPLVSAVIRNRLNDGMMLQIDATLLYARGDRTNNLSNADKLVDSPYNTYKYTGLPPTPIATVTGPALLAATAPADVPYIFYVLTDAEGHHAFAVTLEEHNRNVADSRRRGVF